MKKRSFDRFYYAKDGITEKLLYKLIQAPCFVRSFFVQPLYQSLENPLNETSI